MRLPSPHTWVMPTFSPTIALVAMALDSRLGAWPNHAGLLDCSRARTCLPIRTFTRSGNVGIGCAERSPHLAAGTPGHRLKGCGRANRGQRTKERCYTV